MFLKSSTGEKLDVVLKMPRPSTIEGYGKKPEGSNKMILYIALVIGVVVAIGSAYLIYVNVKGDDKKRSRESFGYRLK